MFKPSWRLRYIWQTLREINPLQRRYFLKAVIVHWISLSAIRTVGFGKYFQWINQLLARQASANRSINGVSSQIQKAMIIEKACRYTSHSSTCLSRSITIYWIMQRQNIPVDLQIGFRIREKILEGHAWIELDGQVLNDDGEVQSLYTIIDNKNITNTQKLNNYDKFTFN